MPLTYKQTGLVVLLYDLVETDDGDIGRVVRIKGNGPDSALLQIEDGAFSTFTAQPSECTLIQRDF